MTNIINTVSQNASAYTTGTGEIILFVALVAVSIGSWALSRKYRERYGTEEMSRIRGFGLLLGMMVTAVGAMLLIETVTGATTGNPVESIQGGAITVVAGTLLSVLCCMGILRRYSGGQAFAMIARLFVVGLAVYLVASWIAVALLLRLFSRLLPRRRYVVVEVD